MKVNIESVKAVKNGHTAKNSRAYKMSSDCLETQTQTRLNSTQRDTLLSLGFEDRLRVATRMIVESVKAASSVKSSDTVQKDTNVESSNPGIGSNIPYQGFKYKSPIQIPTPAGTPETDEYDRLEAHCNCWLHRAMRKELKK